MKTYSLVNSSHLSIPCLNKSKRFNGWPQRTKHSWSLWGPENSACGQKKSHFYLLEAPANEEKTLSVLIYTNLLETPKMAFEAALALFLEYEYSDTSYNNCTKPWRNKTRKIGNSVLTSLTNQLAAFFDTKYQ